MAKPPANSKNIEGCTSYGVDNNGNYVFFGFRCENASDANFTTNHHGLGNVINYLQAIAREAQQRRLKVDPTAVHTEVREKQSNPVRQFDIDPDVTGQFALWQCTMQDGTRLEVQIPLDLMEGIVAHLPSTIDEMKKRQAEHKRQH